MVSVVPIDTPSLGDRSYLVSDGEIAVVIDPQRDIDRVLQLAGATGVRITQVFETHVHNDYVSGGLELARVAGADYLLAADDAAAFPRVGLGDRAVVQTGALTVRALHTPGHTFTHLSYLVEAEGRPVGVFTGGSLLYGSTGRPDLLGPDATPALVRAQYRSARRLAAELPADTPVYPTHGFGSFCSASQSEADSSTLAQETRSNPVLTLDEDAYVGQLLAGLGAYPTYYAQMAPVNRAGPAPVDLSPPVVADVEQLRRRLAAGEWLVDLRPGRAFAHGHAAGTVSVGLDGNLATYLGWVMPWGTPVTLLGETREQVAQAQREMVRIGIDRPAAAATGSPSSWAGGAALRSFNTADFAALAAPPAVGEREVLDVRRNEEWRDSHVAGARHLPLHELPARLAEVPPDKEIWVYCATGYRSAIAASLLERAGRRVVMIDDEFANAGAAGVTLATGDFAEVSR